MLSTHSPLTSGSIDAIDWQHATRLSSGCCGVVYEVAPGIVAKVAPRLDPTEAGIQVLLAQEGLALPVLSYAQQMWLPPAIRRAACSPHGLRPWNDAPVRGPQPVDMLLMPRVERTCGDDDDELEDNDEVVVLAERVGQVCWQTAHRRWDCHPGNIAVYQGRYVALDFGDVSGTLRI